MEDSKHTVINWIKSGADYIEGIALYTRFGKNRNMAALFPGKKHRYELKLRYELCKSVGLDWKNIPGDDSGSFSPLGQPVNAVCQDDPLSGFDDDGQYPAIIRRVIHEYAECYRERGKLHFEMCNVPENNEAENTALRCELLGRIKHLSARMEVLFQAKECYFESKVIPDADSLWPPDKQVQKTAEKPLPSDPAELRRLKKNLQTYNVKDNNLLLYQSATALNEKHPMPAGPRRVGIEKRIQSRLKLIEQIEYRLVENAG